MSFLILSPSHQYFTGDWNEETPKWTTKLEEAYHFETREKGLEVTRSHITLDQAAERMPAFAGARVASFQSEVLRLLKQQGHRVDPYGSGVLVVVEPSQAQTVKQKLSAEIAGVFVAINTTVNQKIR